MSSYTEKLKAYLGTAKQDEIAASLGCSQPAVSRYANGDRFPNADMARRIDEASAGEVSFILWQEEAMRRLTGEAA